MYPLLEDRLEIFRRKGSLSLMEDFWNKGILMMNYFLLFVGKMINTFLFASILELKKFVFAIMYVFR